MGSNDRGFDFDEIDLEVLSYRDDEGNRHDVVEHPDEYPTDTDLVRADYAVVQISYPDGHTEIRTFSGPFEDGYEDLYEWVYDWFENDTP